MSDQFVDYDFTTDPRYVFGDAGHRCFSEFKAHFSDSINVIPESQWKDLIALMDSDGGGADRMVTRIYDQKQEGSCVANACSQACEIIQAIQFGKENVTQLSAMSLYRRIGRSAQSGAMIDDGLEEMAERGVLPLDTPENRAKFGDKVMPNTGWSNKFPDAWEQTAKRFRATEWFIVDSVNELVTATLLQMPVVVGRQGHSIAYVRPMYRNGPLVAKYANSWGNWGDHGFGYDTLNQIRMSANWAFALRSVVVN